ncbi:hypothetical protein V502_02676, partial [Pseudogymnoascus sp. VKM F-4520 (FW-2644)]
RLPHRLRMQLRENRQGSTLPDSPGQIWMELATAAKFDPSLFQGVDRPVKYEMLDMLGLSGPVEFPIQRLVTLWRNLSWQTIITSFEWTISQGHHEAGERGSRVHVTQQLELPGAVESSSQRYGTPEPLLPQRFARRPRKSQNQGIVMST